MGGPLVKMKLKRALVTIYKNVYLKFFRFFIYELGRELDECKSVLDLGCGSSSPLKLFRKKFYSVGVDISKSSVEESKKRGIHNEYFVLDVLNIDKKFSPNSFDCVIALDLIEHLEKQQGIDLIKMMEKIAKKKVIIFTPNGFLPQGEYRGNKWQVHKSGWSVKEMRERGYKVIGINGWKSLRGEKALLRFRPQFFWKIVSDITQLFVRNRPEKAFQILCIKDIK